MQAGGRKLECKPFLPPAPLVPSLPFQPILHTCSLSTHATALLFALINSLPRLTCHPGLFLLRVQLPSLMR